MNKKSLYFLSLLLVLFCLFGLTNDIAWSAGKAVTELGNPLSSAGKQITFTDVSARFIKLSFAIISFTSLLFFMYGGFKYMTAESAKDTADSKKILYTSIAGIAIAFAAYSIINTIFDVVIF